MTDTDSLINKKGDLFYRSKRFKPFRDVLISDEDENAFRQWMFNDDRRLIHGIFILSLTAIFLYLVMDLTFNDLEVEIPLLVARFVTLIIFLLLYYLFLNSKTIRGYELIVFSLISLICFLGIYSNAYRPVNYFTHAGVDVTVIFVCYVSSSISILYRLSIAFIFSVAMLLMLFLYKEPEFSITYYSYTLSVVIANLFGYVLSLITGRTKRDSYLMMISEKRAKDAISTLEGIIPICSYCKHIRDDEGSWEKLEAYIRSHSNAKFSHGVCPACAMQVLTESKQGSD